MKLLLSFCVLLSLLSFVMSSNINNAKKRHICRTCNRSFNNILNHLGQNPDTCGSTQVFSEWTGSHKHSRANETVQNETLIHDEDGDYRSDQDSSLPAGYDSDNVDELAGMTERDVYEKKNHPLLGLCLEYKREDFFGKAFFEKHDVSLMRVYDFCEDKCIARDFADEFLKVIAEEMRDNSFDPRTCGSMSSFLDRMKKQVKPVEPEVTPVVLETDRTDDNLSHQDVMDVTGWSIDAQVKSLLADYIPFADLNNLL